jgi:heme A synthase
MLNAVSTFHTTWGYIAAGFSGVVGLWGVAMARRSEAPKAFLWAVAIAIGALLLQIVTGVAVASGGVNPGNQHVFYGVVTAVTFTFVYIYRSQFRKRPTLYYGLLLLFSMGLGIRGIMTFGHSF